MSVAVRVDREGDRGRLVPSGPFDLAHAAAVARGRGARAGGPRRVPLDRRRPRASRSDRRRRRRPAGAASSIGWTRAGSARGSSRRRNPEAARLIALYRGGQEHHPAPPRRAAHDAGADRRRRGAAPRHPQRRPRLHRPLRRRAAEGGGCTALGRLALAPEAAPGDRGRWPRGHGRRQPSGRPDHRTARHLAAGALRRGRLRPRAGRRRPVPRAWPAGHGDRRRRPIGRRPRVGARDDEGVGRDRRAAGDGVRPGAVAGRAAVPRARHRAAAADLGGQRCWPSSAGFAATSAVTDMPPRAYILATGDAITAGPPARRAGQDPVSRARDRAHRMRAGSGRARRRRRRRREDDAARWCWRSSA